MRLLGSSSR